MYLILEHGILFYPSVDRRGDPVVKWPPDRKNSDSIEGRITLKAACNAFDYKSMTLLVSMQSATGNGKDD